MQTKDDEKMAQALVEAYEKLKSQVQQVIVGQDGDLEQLLIAMLAGTLFARGVQDWQDTHGAIIGSSNQPEFPPDTIHPDLNADITGTDIIQKQNHGHRELVFEKVRSFPKSYWRTK